MAAMHREHESEGAHPRQAPMRCVLFGPADCPTPPELQRSLEARGGAVSRPADEYAALVSLIELNHRDADAGPGPIVLLLLEPELHADRCAQLARAVQLYAPRAVVWQHTRSSKPNLSAYRPAQEPDEAHFVEETREAARSSQSPYEKAARAAAGPSLRLVIDEDPPAPTRADAAHTEDEDQEPDGLLSADEIEMLMDPLFETKPRRGGDQR